MAYSPRFGQNIITAAQRLHDNRTVAESSGDGTLRYSSDMLRRYQNISIRDVVRDLYLQHGDGVDKIIPELVSESGDLVLAAAIATNPADCWIVLEAAEKTYAWYGWKVNANPLKVRSGRDAFIQPTTAKPAWYQVGLTVQFLPVTLTGTVHIWYLQTPADVVLDTLGEVKLAPVWDGEIVRRMVEMGLQDAKSSVAI